MISLKEIQYVRKQLIMDEYVRDDFEWDYYFKICEFDIEEDKLKLEELSKFLRKTNR